MTRRTELICAGLLASVPAVLLAADVGSAGDYGLGRSIGDTPAPTIAALLHGSLSTAARVQPVMGLTSVLLRAPAVVVASLLGGGPLLKYRLGLLVCTWVAGSIGLFAAQLARERGRSALTTCRGCAQSWRVRCRSIPT